MLDTCWATRVAFDMDDVVAPGVHELRAASSTWDSRTDAGPDFVGLFQTWPQRTRRIGLGRGAKRALAQQVARPAQTFRARAILDRSGNWLADIRRRCRQDIGNPGQV